MLWIALSLLAAVALIGLAAFLIDSPEPAGKHAAPAHRPRLRALHDTGTMLASEIQAWRP